MFTHILEILSYLKIISIFLIKNFLFLYIFTMNIEHCSSKLGGVTLLSGLNIGLSYFGAQNIRKD